MYFFFFFFTVLCCVCVRKLASPFNDMVISCFLNLQIIMLSESLHKLSKTVLNFPCKLKLELSYF